jgi:hypothetical protein
MARFSLSLEEAHLNYIGRALGRMPYDEVHMLIKELTNQVQAQQPLANRPPASGAPALPLPTPSGQPAAQRAPAPAPTEAPAQPAPAPEPAPVPTEAPAAAPQEAQAPAPA